MNKMVIGWIRQAHVFSLEFTGCGAEERRLGQLFFNAYLAREFLGLAGLCLSRIYLLFKTSSKRFLPRVQIPQIGIDLLLVLGVGGQFFLQKIRKFIS